MKNVGIAFGGGMAFGAPRFALLAVGILAIFGVLYLKDHATKHKTQI